MCMSYDGDVMFPPQMVNLELLKVHQLLSPYTLTSDIYYFVEIVLLDIL